MGRSVLLFGFHIYIYSLVIPVYILISSWWISILPQLNTHICWWIPIVRWYCLRFNLNSYLLSFYIHICMAESSQRTPRRFFFPRPFVVPAVAWMAKRSRSSARRSDHFMETKLHRLEGQFQKTTRWSVISCFFFKWFFGIIGRGCFNNSGWLVSSWWERWAAARIVDCWIEGFWGVADLEKAEL